MSNGLSLLTGDAPIRPLQQEEFPRFRCLASFSEYRELATIGRESDVLPEMVDLLTTNVLRKRFRLNLVDKYSHPVRFSMIWGRNLMIYFDGLTRERVVRLRPEWLEPGGCLLLGHSEAMNGIRRSPRYMQLAVYRKP